MASSRTCRCRCCRRYRRTLSPLVRYRVPLVFRNARSRLLPFAKIGVPLPLLLLVFLNVLLRFLCANEAQDKAKDRSH